MEHGRTLPRLWLWLGSVLAVGVLAIGCSRGESGKASKEQWVDSLRRAHSSADGAETVSDRVAAIEKLRTEVDRLPAGGSLQARWVKQDLLGRMATLQIEVGEPERALGTVKKGLEVSPEPSVPRSNLYIAEGQALTALGRKDEAIEPYYQALLVNEALMQEALKSEGTP